MSYYPLKMLPCYKEYLWGGTRLKKEYGKLSAPEMTAESWELACHPDGSSVVAEGPLAGKSLADLARRDQEGYWGQACSSGEFPILVKLIDAEKDLSIQVHPSDRSALTGLGERGKAEMWYIVDCRPKSFLYFGFSRCISPEEFLTKAADGTICEVLNKVPVSKGNVLYILPGTIHAIGAGMVVAEIQQSSNTTFRIYDYQRRDANGSLRPLHLERAAQVADYQPIIPEKCRANACTTFPTFTVSEMFNCRYFRAYRLDVRERVTLCCDGISFQHLLCVEGAGNILHDGKSYPFRQGGSYFLPAALGEYTVVGACRVLLSRV